MLINENKRRMNEKPTHGHHVDNPMNTTINIRSTIRNGSASMKLLMIIAALGSGGFIPASHAAEQLIQPVGITQLAGDAMDPIVVLISNDGLSEPATIDNYMTVTNGGGATRWVTATGTWPTNYFVAGATPPKFEFALGGSFLLTDLVIWGYSGNLNEATDFHLEFSNDNGATYPSNAVASSTHLLGFGSGRLPLGGSFLANRVRITITNNAQGRGFPPPPGEGGGDRVGMAKVRFIGLSTEQLIQPVGITQLAGDAIDPIVVLISNDGLSEPATIDNYMTVTNGGGATRWVTSTGTWPTNYFVAGATPPKFKFTLGGSFSLSDLVIWGYSGNLNEATDFFVEFSNDNGVTYPSNTTAASTHLLGFGSGRLPFVGGSFVANSIRMTITNNAQGRGFPPPPGEGGGDRVGMAKVRFIGLSAVGPGVPPTFTYQPASQRVMEATAAIFTVTVAGSQPLSYQWQFNSNNIARATNATLTLNNVQPASAGKYRVNVTNSAGFSVSDEAVLAVFPAPQFGQVMLAPVAITQLAGDSLPGYMIVYLINGEGLLTNPATIQNYFSDTHTNVGRWVTATGTWPANYFAAGATPPEFEFTLDDTYGLSDLVVWGYDNNNEGTDFHLEFSSDNGASYPSSVNVASPFRTGWDSMCLPFGSAFKANRVRMTITNNGGGRGFPGAGGDRVALSEVRFITAAKSLPSLSVIRTGDAVTISWPIIVTGFTLQSSPQLPASSWLPVPGVVNNQITINPATGSQFFRLVNQ